MERSLYLIENGHIKAIADGPSILVNLPQKSMQRVPLRLIGRVVVIGNIHIETTLFCLLAEHNIPVLIMDLAGRKRAVVIPLVINSLQHSRWQKLFLISTRYREKFINWAKTKRAILQIKVLQRLFPRKARMFSRGVGEGNYQLAIKPFLPLDKDKLEAARNFVSSLFQGSVIKHAIDAGLDINLGIIHKRSHLGLAHDLGFVVEPQVDEQLIEFFRAEGQKKFLERDFMGWKLTREGVRNIIQRFEEKRKEIDEIIENIIDEIFYLMRELSV